MSFNQILLDPTLNQHKDPLSDIPLPMYEYLRQAAEKSSCQEGLAAEQQSAASGTILAVPLPGSGPLRYALAPVSSACRRQRRRRRAPVPDSVAVQSDAPAPSSTGGPHDAATPGSGARLPPLSGLALEERSKEPSTSAAAPAKLSMSPASSSRRDASALCFPGGQRDIATPGSGNQSPPLSGPVLEELEAESSSPTTASRSEFPAGFSSCPGRRRRRRAVAIGEMRRGASYSSTEGPSAMASSQLSSPELVGGHPAPSERHQSSVQPPTPAWFQSGPETPRAELMRLRFMDFALYLRLFPEDLDFVHLVLEAEFLGRGWLHAHAPVSTGGPFAPLLEAAVGSPEPPLPRLVLEEPLGGLPPRPGPEHLLSFLWGVFMEIKPDSRPAGTKPDSRPAGATPDSRAPTDSGPPDSRTPTDCDPDSRAPTDSEPDSRAPTDSEPDSRAPTDSKPDSRAPTDTEPDFLWPRCRPPDVPLRDFLWTRHRPPDHLLLRCWHLRCRPPNCLHLCCWPPDSRHPCCRPSDMCPHGFSWLYCQTPGRLLLYYRLP
ncbi:hypothetical protein CRENBAI_008743 [Crenichthys baileyi]|uniref:Uncharacterized protein n=1 Tax=Crenichthys baileyi TaxID=28760 RepID=A0AAV9R4Q1_9TELE